MTAPRWGAAPPPWWRRAVLFVLAGIVALQVAEWSFTQLRSFLGLLFLAWMFAIAVEPVVNALERRGMRRGLATGIVLFGLLLAVIGFFAVFGTVLVDQLTQLIASAPSVVRSLVDWANRTFGTDLRPADILDSLNLTPERIQELVGKLTPGILGIVSSVVGWVFQALTLLLFAFYMSAEGPALRRTVSRRFPPRQQQVILTVWAIAVAKAGGYVFSRLVLAVLSSVFTGILLAVLGVPYWLPLALWTGLVSQFIPTIGTYLAIAVPALVALAEQPADAIWVVGFGVVYQQLENYLFAPRITARSVDIHPAVAFGSVIVGAALFGPLGALVSIPVVATIEAVIDTYGHRYELIPDDRDLAVPPAPPPDGEPPPVKQPPRPDHPAVVEP
jgi:predicted PurR-regulated permease PerM